MADLISPGVSGDIIRRKPVIIPSTIIITARCIVHPFLIRRASLIHRSLAVRKGAEPSYGTTHSR
jgi:hypothetical protein